jgi:DNA-binding response OmpR family regulator
VMTREGTRSTVEPQAATAEYEAPPVVVVVEDDIGTLGLLADVAEDAGWEARTCRSLRQLEHTLDDVAPSLVILDDELPDGRGGDEVLNLRSNPKSADVPVVICTAAPTRRLAELREAAPVVTKPFTVTDIERVLDAALRRRRGRMASEAAG